LADACNCQVGIDVMSFALKEDSITNADSSVSGVVSADGLSDDTLLRSASKLGKATKLVNITGFVATHLAGVSTVVDQGARHRRSTRPLRADSHRVSFSCTRVS
jgi:hypothetical protein